MPLHPVAEKFIATAKEAGFGPVCGLPVDEARRVSKEMFASAPPGEPVAKVEDIAIPGGVTGDIPARVYTPAGEGPFPILVHFHGGGWVVGDLDGSDFECRALANAGGCVLVSVDYCLAPENKFPAPAEDAYRATCWVAENAAALGGNGDVGVSGMSAGGNLAAVVALMARDREGPELVCQLLVVPVTDCGCDTASHVECGDEYLLTREEMQWFWSQYLATPKDGDLPYASPLRAPDLSGLPPARVHTAEFDPLRDEGQAYAERLQAAGVPVSYRCYEGMIHMVQGAAATVDLGEFLKQTFSQRSDTGVS